MKTILVYAERFGANYDGFYRSLLREGRMRGWRFAWLAYRDAPDEPERIARMFGLLKPVGFVGGAIHGIAVAVPDGIPAVWVDCGRIPKGAVAVEHDNASFGLAAAKALGDAESAFAVFGFSGHSWSATRAHAFASFIRQGDRRCRTFTFPKDALSNPYMAFERLREMTASQTSPSWPRSRWGCIAPTTSESSASTTTSWSA